jgi:hypothetical protein
MNYFRQWHPASRSSFFQQVIMAQAGSARQQPFLQFMGEKKKTEREGR